MEVPTGSHELLPALARLPGHLLWRGHARVTQTLVDLLPADVEIHAYAVLVALRDHAPRSQQTLADITATSGTTLTKVTAGLILHGLVERVRNPVDRRSYLLTPTPAARPALAEWDTHVQAVECAIRMPLAALESDELAGLLARVARPVLSPETPDHLFARVSFLLAKLHLHVHREFATALEDLRIEPRHFAVLTALTATGPVPQSELARLLGLSGASVVEMTDHLEARGLVERRRSTSDRRTQLLHLTPEAPAVLADATSIASTTLDPRLSSLSPAEVERMITLLQTLVSAPIPPG